MRWHVDIAAWYLRHYGRQPIVTRSRLILPGPHCYRLDAAPGDALAREVYDQTQALAHLDAVRIRPPVFADTSDAYRMVVVSARRLARAVVASAPERPPVERSDIPGAIDVVACMMGFGVFLANHAIIDTYGYGSRGKLRLSSVRDPDCMLGEDELVFGIALFLTFRGLKPAGAYDYLEKHLNERLGQALRDAAAFGDELKATAG